MLIFLRPNQKKVFDNICNRIMRLSACFLQHEPPFSVEQLLTASTASPRPLTQLGPPRVRCTRTLVSFLCHVESDKAKVTLKRSLDGYIIQTSN